MRKDNTDAISLLRRYGFSPVRSDNGVYKLERRVTGDDMAVYPLDKASRVTAVSGRLYFRLTRDDLIPLQQWQCSRRNVVLLKDSYDWADDDSEYMAVYKWTTYLSAARQHNDIAIVRISTDRLVRITVQDYRFLLGEGMSTRLGAWQVSARGLWADVILMSSTFHADSISSAAPIERTDNMNSFSYWRGIAEEQQSEGKPVYWRPYSAKKGRGKSRVYHTSEANIAEYDRLCASERIELSSGRSKASIRKIYTDKATISIPRAAAVVSDGTADQVHVVRLDRGADKNPYFYVLVGSFAVDMSDSAAVLEFLRDNICGDRWLNSSALWDIQCWRIDIGVPDNLTAAGFAISETTD